MTCKIEIMKKIIAREYILVILGLSLGFLTFLGLTGWTKVNEGLWRRQYAKFSAIEKSYFRFNEIHYRFSECYYDIKDKEESAQLFRDWIWVKNTFQYLQNEDNYSVLSSCELRLGDYLASLYKEHTEMSDEFNHIDGNIIQRYWKEKEVVERYEKRTIPYNESSLKSKVDFRVFRIDMSFKDFGQRERWRFETYLSDYQRFNDSYDLFVVPKSKVQEFFDECKIIEEIEVPTPDESTVISLTMSVLIAYFVLVFLLRYFIYSVLWGFRVWKNKS